MKKSVYILLSVLWLSNSCIAKPTFEYKKSDEDPVKEEVVDADKQIFDAVNWNWTKEQSGVIRGYSQFRMFGRTMSISIVKYSEDELITSLIYNKENDCVTVPEAAEAAKAEAALNASYFYTKTSGENIKWTASTTLCMDGEIIHTSNEERSNGIIGLDKGGVITIMPYNHYKVNDWKDMYKSLISSGPLLIYNNKVQSFAKNKFNETNHPRTMMGVTEDRTVIYVVVDGRFENLGEGASISELARIASYLGMTDAINLDGGGSSTIWTSEAGVINFPYDNGKWDHEGCRRVPTVIIAK